MWTAERHFWREGALIDAMNDPCAVTLRPARLAEAAELALLSRELIEAGLDWRYTPQRMAALIGDPDTVALVACESVPTRTDAQLQLPPLQGFAVMQFGDSDAHLVLLCVRSTRQRRGIGRCLHDWLVKSARVAGISAIQLELRADNAAALSFYQRLGFVETQQFPGYYEGRIAARRMRLAWHAAVT